MRTALILATLACLSAASLDADDRRRGSRRHGSGGFFISFGVGHNDYGRHPHSYHGGYWYGGRHSHGYRPNDYYREYKRYRYYDEYDCRPRHKGHRHHRHGRGHRCCD